MARKPSYSPEKELIKHIISASKEQGILGRPIANGDDAVNVTIGLGVFKVVEVDSAGYATVHGCLKMSWKDPVLKWDPKKFGGVSSVALPSTCVWRPDITVWNDLYQLPAEQVRGMLEFEILAFPDGTVWWIPNMVLKVLSTNIPDGNKKISLRAGSWIYDRKKLSVGFENNVADVDVDWLEETPGIQLVGHCASIEDKEYPACPGLLYSIIEFNIVVKK